MARGMDEIMKSKEPRHKSKYQAGKGSLLLHAMLLEPMLWLAKTAITK
jgi:hypothetical protein